MLPALAFSSICLYFMCIWFAVYDSNMLLHLDNAPCTYSSALTVFLFIFSGITLKGWNENGFWSSFTGSGCFTILSSSVHHNCIRSTGQIRHHLFIIFQFIVSYRLGSLHACRSFLNMHLYSWCIHLSVLFHGAIETEIESFLYLSRDNSDNYDCWSCMSWSM